MKYFLYTWMVTLGIMLIIDYVWLTSMFEVFYKQYLGNLFTTSLRYAPAILFYVMYTGGLTYLIIFPSLSVSTSLYEVASKSAIIGCMAYGAYDLTNQATLLEWPVIVTIIDMIWGTFVTSVSASLSYLILKRILF